MRTAHFRCVLLPHSSARHGPFWCLVAADRRRVARWLTATRARRIRVASDVRDDCAAHVTQTIRENNIRPNHAIGFSGGGLLQASTIVCRVQTCRQRIGTHPARGHCCCSPNGDCAPKSRSPLMHHGPHPRRRSLLRILHGPCTF